MKKHILTAEQMKTLDSMLINEIGIPSRTLMETAGKGCTDFLIVTKQDKMQKGVCVLCGFGNNGGDGLVIARWLHLNNIEVTVIMVARGNMSPDTQANLSACEKLKIPVFKVWELNTDDDGKDDVGRLLNTLENASMVIDAVYGVGFRGKLNEQILKLFDCIREFRPYVVAIDVPSGMDADTGMGENILPAHQTLVIGALKHCHVLPHSTAKCGNLELIDIGIPLQDMDKISKSWLFHEKMDVPPVRKSDSHKGQNGRVAVFAGSPGYTGAAFLAATACLRTGAGLVTIFAHPGEMEIYNNKPYEVMVKEVPVTVDGRPDKSALKEILTGYDVLLFGPGYGVTNFNAELLEQVLSFWTKRGVIDADGLTLIAQKPQLLSHIRGKEIILTPHWGEFSRLVNKDTDAIRQDCINILEDFAKTHVLKVLLKSNVTIYQEPDYRFFVKKGNAGLAKGGSGDVLSGLIAGYLTSFHNAAFSAINASWQLGKTVEMLSQESYSFSILPSDIVDSLFILPGEEKQ